ncbi:MAG: squalene--hopene cyclase [Bacteroidaceae bacterium]|nr:squalene--hopene cyclase [Bacteroidaceae bacterium]
MTHEEKIQTMLDDATQRLMSKRRADGMWQGHLSSSAISTSVSVFALSVINREEYAHEIQQGTSWLLQTMKPDGAWGDSVESPANMTATLLSYAALSHLGQVPEATERHIRETQGWKNEADLIKGVLDYYGRDLTFSVPILMMCALAGIVSDWKRIPPFPFELAVLPQSTFRFLNLPVVSYAIPALIAVGILQNRKRHTWLSPVREKFVPKSLKVLTTLQPEDGGFLEAAPLTAFVSMCLSEAGLRDHVVTTKCAQFLRDTLREDGAWPIDTNLAGWVTSLSARAIGDLLPDNDRKALADTIRSNATQTRHPFTGAPAGGWGWTNLSGSVPDGDDTSGALVALHRLLNGRYVDEVGAGIDWLIQLQNRDGGMPTFCRGWGKLPFDRSTPDITAHAILAMSLWCDALPVEQQPRCRQSIQQMTTWLEKAMTHDGAWNPLWFGDQDAKDEKNPVYGAATIIDYLSVAGRGKSQILQQPLRFLLTCQNADGGWGGNSGVSSKVTLTAKAIGALAQFRPDTDGAIRRAIDYLYAQYQSGTLYRREPIGLYFSRLWYSEALYSYTYLVTALRQLLQKA